MTNAIVLTDLDDTFFCSKSKCKGKKILEQATNSTTGKHSYSDQKQRLLLQGLKNIGTVIPVTARGSLSFDTVMLTFGHKAAILANGAVIRKENGEVDMNWFNTVKKISNTREKDLKAMERLVTDLYGDKVRLWIQHELGHPIYLVVKSNSEEFETYEQAEQLLEEVRSDLLKTPYVKDCMVHLNGNNLAITPNGISKKAAVSYLLETAYNQIPLTLGVGDSHTDVPFMALCDFIIAPQKSQILTKLLSKEAA